MKLKQIAFLTFAIACAIPAIFAETVQLNINYQTATYVHNWKTIQKNTIAIDDQQTIGSVIADIEQAFSADFPRKTRDDIDSISIIYNLNAQSKDMLFADYIAAVKKNLIFENDAIPVYVKLI